MKAIHTSRSLRLSGDVGGGLLIMRELIEAQSSNGLAIHEYAECLYASGGRENLKQAGVYFDRLIQSLPVDEKGKYPPLYWNAWMRRLQISDQFAGEGESILRRIKQLGYIDHELGGEPYRTQLNKLAEKYSQ